MGESLFKNVIDEICSTIEDLFLTFIGATLIIFMAGQFFGVLYAKTQVFWYPLWAFIIILLIKIFKDAFFQIVDKD